MPPGNTWLIVWACPLARDDKVSKGEVTRKPVCAIILGMQRDFKGGMENKPKRFRVVGHYYGQYQNGDDQRREGFNRSA